MALNLAPFSHWTLRDKAAQRRLATAEKEAIETHRLNDRFSSTARHDRQQSGRLNFELRKVFKGRFQAVYHRNRSAAVCHKLPFG